MVITLKGAIVEHENLNNFILTPSLPQNGVIRV
ncbi:hypothetical protein J2S17_003542 [Cytobacillus purgationiresistens]|uniref:Uncharacterized protein n=1 Tax=Cytobacillus purgationiresistens TaxID=863449 RepID=A0ABU0AL89_9BACI|nr:hypothetical protein [Cytobacillus purgationiresistens]